MSYLFFSSECKWFDVCKTVMLKIIFPSHNHLIFLSDNALISLPKYSRFISIKQ